jgi:hypothetical protein
MRHCPDEPAYPCASPLHAYRGKNGEEKSAQLHAAKVAEEKKNSPVHLACGTTGATAAGRCPLPLRPAAQIRALCPAITPGIPAPSLRFTLCKTERPNPNLSYSAICIRIGSNHKSIHVLCLVNFVFNRVYPVKFTWVLVGSP